MRGTSRGPEIIVVGHILNEKIVFPDRVIAPVLGSPAAYSSVCLASLGVKVGVVSKIGSERTDVSHSIKSFILSLQFKMMCKNSP